VSHFAAGVALMVIAGCLAAGLRRVDRARRWRRLAGPGGHRLRRTQRMSDDPVVQLPAALWDRIVGLAREGGMTDLDRLLETAWGRGAIIGYVFGFLSAAARHASAEEQIDALSRAALTPWPPEAAVPDGAVTLLASAWPSRRRSPCWRSSARSRGGWVL
jgi:hypothetical protein